MPQERVDRTVVAVLSIAVVGVVAAIAFALSRDHERYVIGAPDWVEASFAGFYLVDGAIISAIALASAAVIRAGRPGSRRRLLGQLLVLGVVGLWGGYVLGVASAWASGPPEELAGGVRFVISGPVDAVVEEPATCETVVGDDRVIAVIRPHDLRLGYLVLRNIVSRDVDPTWVTPRLGDDYPLPGVDPGLLAAHDWHRVSFADQDGSGTLRLDGHLRGDGPWTSGVMLDISWTCHGG